MAAVRVERVTIRNPLDDHWPNYSSSVAAVAPRSRGGEQNFTAFFKLGTSLRAACGGCCRLYAAGPAAVQPLTLLLNAAPPPAPVVVYDGGRRAQGLLIPGQSRIMTMNGANVQGRARVRAVGRGGAAGDARLCQRRWCSMRLRLQGRRASRPYLRIAAVGRGSRLGCGPVRTSAAVRLTLVPERSRIVTVNGADVSALSLEALGGAPRP